MWKERRSPQLLRKFSSVSFSGKRKSGCTVGPTLASAGRVGKPPKAGPSDPVLSGGGGGIAPSLSAYGSAMTVESDDMTALRGARNDSAGVAKRASAMWAATSTFAVTAQQRGADDSSIKAQRVTW
eukprot:7101322-Prymnesium_polylepis.2